MPRPVSRLLLALPILTVSAQVACAEDCFGGVTCEEAALAAMSFKLARDCPSVLQIAPNRAGEFEKVMYALRHRPMANIWPDEFSDTPRPRSAKECRSVAQKVAQGAVPGLYLAVRTKAGKARGK